MCVPNAATNIKVSINASGRIDSSTAPYIVNFLSQYPIVIPKRRGIARPIPARLSPRSKRRVAAIVMTAWDVVMDPGMSAAGNWIWENGGSYFRKYPYDAAGASDPNAPWVKISRAEYIAEVGTRLRPPAGFGMVALALLERQPVRPATEVDPPSWPG